MSIRLVHLGFGNYLAAGRIVAVAIPKSTPIKRCIQEARDEGLVIDMTNGRKTKSVIFTNAQYLVLSILEPATINGRIEDTA